MKHILLFGAGKSASVLIDYLLDNAAANNWHVTVVDADAQLVLQKTKQHPASTAVAANVAQENERQALIKNADVVISMMPPFLHILIATDCIEFGKHLLTASYADDAIKALAPQAAAKGILFLCEMGLDPGIDHMSALQLLENIKAAGATITSFKSHCGGLVAPESDDNPWHYKISWNPRNVVLAGKAGASYLLNGQHYDEPYETLFNANRFINTGDANIGNLSYYPNRNSLPYIDLYQLQSAQTFVRTTLRYQNFMYGWNHIVALHLTDEVGYYETNELSIAAFFKQHFERFNIKQLFKNSYNANTAIEKIIEKQLQFLGINDDTTLINKGFASAADVLQFLLETKLILHPHDKDMIVMQHEIEYDLHQTKHYITSSCIVYGEDAIYTAMAKTVGLPLGIAAKLILNGSIQLTGLHLPIIKAIYEPVLHELAVNGIQFIETKN
ncbi:saccharopine dehydrogenase C-terminal domain-containing protein [Ferruginibacter yonginensis]|uniref:Saccharopine dehydrogenase C-terminal domain-containing protein n=1 Tax=Ferruginibacter yonginensis TaxID=1310416 RepID=A0ABV8QMH3_9BACT